MRPRGGWIGLVLLLLASCDPAALPPTGQFVVHVTTDAPLPQRAGNETEEVVPLFDRLRIEVFPQGASSPCAECVREFEVDAALVDRGDASMGVVPPSGSVGTRIRVRLFRGTLDATSPRPGSTIEQVIALPRTPEEGIRHLTVTLLTEKVGDPQGTLDDPVVAVAGQPPRGVVGTWSGARRSGCDGSSRDGEVCIPGGPFWLGDPRIDFTGAIDMQGGVERLVVLSPFFLDDREVTVGAFRASGLEERTQSGAVFNPRPAGGGDFCTYRETPGPDDTLPVNCVTWRLAEAYCVSQGKRLPTEAELAYAASGLGEHSYVWGEDIPVCGDAVFERGDADGACATLGLGPTSAGQGARDRLDPGGGMVFDLAGNLMEFAADFWQLDEEPCWFGSGVLRDPLCDEPSALDRIGRTVRGGDFTDPPLFLRAALRTYMLGESKATNEQVGFRCARGGSR